MSTRAPQKAADDRELLVRWWLVGVAEQFGLSCVARVIGGASTSRDWRAVAGDLAFAASKAGSDEMTTRRYLRLARDVAEELREGRAGCVDRAVAHIAAEHRRSAEDWCAWARARRTEKGSALVSAPGPKAGNCTWAHIAVEEMAEAVEAATDAAQGRGVLAALRKELVQLAAVIVAWIEAIDRRGA